jgi:hypothetical protein
MKQQDGVPQASGAFDISRQLNKGSRFYPAKNTLVHHALVKQTASVSQSSQSQVAQPSFTHCDPTNPLLPAAANGGTAAYLSPTHITTAAVFI